jgi:protein-glutamine gamma-glutamyltransferase
MAWIETSMPRWPGWRNLPRETRDTLFLLGVIGWTILPHLARLPWWCVALSALVLLWRAHLALANLRLPGRTPIVALLVIAIALTLWNEQSLFGKEAGVALLVVLMSLKTLELRARRDALVVFFLGFFLVLTHFLYSQSLPTALAMLISVWGLLTALVLAHMPVGKPPLRKAGALAARSAVLGAPLMVLLFVLFPRIGPLWGMPQDAMGRTGLSGTLRLGGVAEVANDNSIAFRVRFEDGVVPDPNTLYFRGPVLSRFDGFEWQRSATPPLATNPIASRIRTIGAGVGYEMTLEPIRLPLVPALEATPDDAAAAPRIEGYALSLRPDLQWQTDRIVTDRVRFSARSWPRFEYGRSLEDNELADALQLPGRFNPLTRAWATQFRRQEGPSRSDAVTLGNAVLEHIRTQEFSYTLAPGIYGRDAIDEFWLDRRIGFCEHFATSFVFVMRAMGVPARVVTGYQGAERSLLDGYYVVRQSHAHAWAEVWQAGRGWVRFDPTAAVAPDRIARSRNLEPTQGFVTGALRTVSPELMLQLRAGWDAINNRWNQWVLNYSRAQQFDLLQRLGVAAPDWQALGMLMLGLMITCALAGAGWALWDRHRQDPWQRLQGQVRGVLESLGVMARPHDPPRRLADRVREQLGERSDALAYQLDILDLARYGPHARRRPDRAWWRRFVFEALRLRRVAVPNRLEVLPAPPR